MLTNGQSPSAPLPLGQRSRSTSSRALVRFNRNAGAAQVESAHASRHHVHFNRTCFMPRRAGTVSLIVLGMGLEVIFSLQPNQAWANIPTLLLHNALNYLPWSLSLSPTLSTVTAVHRNLAQAEYITPTRLVRSSCQASTKSRGHDTTRVTRVTLLLEWIKDPHIHISIETQHIVPCPTDRV